MDIKILLLNVKKQGNEKKGVDDLAMFDIYKAEILTRLEDFKQAQVYLDKFKAGYNNTDIEFSYMDINGKFTGRHILWN